MHSSPGPYVYEARLAMLSKDGIYTFYRIQQRSSKKDKWTYANLDHFGHPKGFGASDECWQATGVMGCYDAKKAHLGLAELREKHAKHKFRLVRVLIKQETETFD